jgi:hypothetical protein
VPVARLLALAAVGLLAVGMGWGQWGTPAPLRKPWLWGFLGSPWYFVWATVLLFVATVFVFAADRIALGLALVGVTAAAAALWFYRYRGGR